MEKLPNVGDYVIIKEDLFENPLFEQNFLSEEEKKVVEHYINDRIPLKVYCVRVVDKTLSSVEAEGYFCHLYNDKETEYPLCLSVPVSCLLPTGLNNGLVKENESVKEKRKVIKRHQFRVRISDEESRYKAADIMVRNNVKVWIENGDTLCMENTANE